MTKESTIEKLVGDFTYRVRVADRLLDEDDELTTFAYGPMSVHLNRPKWIVVLDADNDPLAEIDPECVTPTTLDAVLSALFSKANARL